MKYLFIDASENITHIQTGTENNFSAKDIDTNRDFAAKITEICDNMLKEAGWEQKDLTHLVVCTGPGSLTGLRVADGFLRALAMLLDIPLIGIDLFKWSIQTLSDRNFEGEARLVMPTLIDKAFEVKCSIKTMLPHERWGCRHGWRRASEPQDVSESLSCHEVTEGAAHEVSSDGDIKTSFPVLIEKKAIPSDIKTFGIRYNHESAERLEPSPEALHKLILEEAKTAKTGIDEILKILPLYIIPSQAERNFKGGDK
ncbi:MAG: tRNA (adenosine(37)-N6)-threonylcarbamoyltransferase complex dimerization subunit type 1 TsaB [Candidatus Riflebacteria bacterium]|nr:tRNA (adenosine(37)-N6)-threonylcarbamoyltransferase complex dimerization subunit type 1 TsaB [Candidatus Riflebacteria bacterium]